MSEIENYYPEEMVKEYKRLSREDVPCFIGTIDTKTFEAIKSSGRTYNTIQLNNIIFYHAKLENSSPCDNPEETSVLISFVATSSPKFGSMKEAVIDAGLFVTDIDGEVVKE